MATMAAAAATTKMKAQTASTVPPSASEFLSGGGADLGPVQRKGPIVSAGTDQDDLDLFLSEITVQFDDDEVQTLYVGPVEIVEDDLKNGKVVPKGTSGVETTGPAKQAPLDSNDDVTKASDANLAAATTRKTKQSAENPAAVGGAEEVGGGSAGGRDEAAKEVDSANDGRPHRLTVAATSTEPAVVIDPKNGENSQTVATEDLTPPVTQSKERSSPEKSPTATTIAQSVKPTAIISPSTKRKSPSPTPTPPPQRSHQSQRINKRLKLTTERNPARPTPIKEEIKQLSPKLAPAVPEKQEAAEPEPSQVEGAAGGRGEEEDCPPEGELIVPDVLEYEKDSSPAGSDSGIENEGAEQQLNKPKEVVPEQLPAEPCEVVNETVEHIPETENTQREKESEEEEKRVEPSQGRVIKCAKCVKSFKHVLWYKKHLMNYHGIDLSNIAHFLSNLQTLDEGIQDGEGQDDVEEEYADFQLEKSGTDGGQEASETDKTDGGGNGEQQRVDEFEADGVARLRQQQQEASSTPSPNTLQMYPEVKLSTKSKQIRRRKDKLIPINSDADMKIKHEYVTPSAMGQSDESASSSQSTQPLINNMFVVKYLEQAALMVGAPNTNVLLGLPDTANKENSKSGQLVDPLATEGSEGTDGLTPYERAKIVGVNTDDGPQFTCTVCETVFDERHAAQDHVNFVHKDVKRRSCPHCGRTFTQTGDLTRHVRIHTGIRPFKCPFEGCQFSFISSGDLHKHVRRHQQLVPKPHICGTCGKDFERGYDLKRHSSMHAKDDPNHEFFSCELCSKTFARKDQYRAHTYRHIGYKPHKCRSCNKSFSDASNYSKHLKVHEMDGLFLICHHCSKPFKNKMGISKHVLHCKYKHQTGGDKSAPGRKKVVKKEEVGEASSSHF